VPAFAAFGHRGRERRPAATRRLATAPRTGFELAIVGVATIAVLVAGAPAMAAVLAVLVAMSTALLLRFDQGEA
jgi:hypothetical protein